MIKRLVLVCLFVLLPALAHAVPTTYYVDNQLPGNDSSNNGTSEATPFLTYQRCVAAATTAGDTCLIKNGTYTVPSGGVTVSQSGSVGSPITFKNFPGHTPVLRCADWSVSSCQAFILQPATYPSGAVQWLVIEGLEITNVYYGVKLNLAKNITIRGNHIHHTHHSAIQGNGFRITIDRNHMHHHYDLTLPFDSVLVAYSLYLVGKEYTVTHNVMYAGTGYCLQMAARNQFADAEVNGFSGTVANNTCAYAKYTSGMVVWQEAVGAMGAVTIANNIFLHSCTDATRCASTGRGGIQFLAGSSAIGTQVKNNVHYDADCTNGSCFIYSADGAVNGSTYILTGNSTTVNPNLVNAPSSLPGTPDFSLTSGSVAVNFGTTVSGLVCNGTCDAGAFETFGPGPASTINDVSMDVTVPMNLNVPIAPATGQTVWTVGCTGSNCGTPVVATASKLTGTDSVVRLALSGLGGAGVCEVGQTWTVTYTPGNVTDSANLGGTLTQKMFGFTTQAVTNACTGGGTPPPAGPHLYYKLDDNTGTNCNDETANNLDCTLTGSPLPAWGTGKYSFGVTLTDLIAHYIAIPYGSGENPSSQSHTIAFGVNVPAGTEGNARVVFGADPGTNQQFHISMVGGTWRLGIQASDASIASNLTVVAGWNRLCLVADSATDTATLTANGAVGTSGAAKTYTSYTLASNLRMGSPFGASTSPGVTYDEFKVWRSVVSCADDFAAWEPGSPPPTGTFEQKGHQFHKLRKTSGGAVDNYGALSATVPVVKGGAFLLTTQTDCTVGDCSQVGQRLRYSIDGGPFLEVPDTIGSDGVAFYGAPAASDSDILTGAVSCCLTGSLTANAGATQYTAAAVPVYDITQDASIVQRRVLRLDDTITATTVCFKEYNQTGVPFTTYTPSAGACVAVIPPQAGVGF